jgi:hypothetical protein
MRQRARSGVITFSDHPEFKPNMTPKEMFQAGVFGGTYVRPIKSRVTGKSHRGAHKEFPKSWFTGVVVDNLKCDAKLNKYGVASGSSLKYWEDKKWITKQDPYGWVQWYCRFYQGRRSRDDDRQIARWLGIAGPTGRFRRRLYGMYAKSRKSVSASAMKSSEPPVSPKIHQLLIQWAYAPNMTDYRAYARASKN